MPHDTLAVFPTLVHAFMFDLAVLDTKSTVLEFVGELRMHEAGLTDSPEAGDRQFDWMSSTDLHEHPALGGSVADWLAACRVVLDDEGWAYDDVEITECWANVSGPGNSHRVHAHPNSVLSGVLYVAIPEGAGQIEFRDPRNTGTIRLDRARATPATALSIGVSPVEGLLLIFPSWLSHSVAANQGAGERVSIAFNVMPVGRIGQPTASFDR